MRVAIVGAGVGGLTTALFLHSRGIECKIYEQVSPLRELGVGITLQTNAVKALVGLGLFPALDAVAVRGEHLYYFTRRGQLVWDEPRGLAAGHDTPQFFIHRGHLQSLLHRAVLERLPAGALRLGHRLSALRQSADDVELTFVDRDGVTMGKTHADFVVGADGIHSTVRTSIIPGEGDPRWSGLVLWRGATDWPGFLGGASLLIAGGVNTKFVSYPIAPGLTPQTRLTNWVAQARVAPEGSPLPDQADWNRTARREDLAPIIAQFSVPQIDIPALVAATEVCWEFPMFDRNPAPHWSVGRATLLGDAAHPMYPMGGNGASQAILDASCLTDAMMSHDDIGAALAAYEAERLPKAAAIVHSNRSGGPESVIDAVEERAPNGFDDVNAVLAHAEREAIVRGYAKQSGYGRETPSHAGRSLVSGLADALNTHDLVRARSYLADDVRFIGTFGPPIDGADAYLAAMARLGAQQIIVKCLVERDEVACQYDLTLPGTPDTPIFCCGWFTISDGRIKSLRVVFDPTPLGKTRQHESPHARFAPAG